MDDSDIYANLPATDLGEEIEKLRGQNNLLKDHIQSLEGDVERLCTRITEMKGIQNNLAKNISELYKTAKAEIDRKDRTINDLRTQLEQHIMQKRMAAKREREYSPAGGPENVKKFETENRFKSHTSNMENKGQSRSTPREEYTPSHRSRSGDRNYKKGRTDKQEFDRKRRSEKERKHKVDKPASKIQTVNPDLKKVKQATADEKIKNKTEEEKDVNKNDLEFLAKKEKSHEKKGPFAEFKENILESKASGTEVENNVQNVGVKSDENNKKEIYKEKPEQDNVINKEIVKLKKPDEHEKSCNEECASQMKSGGKKDEDLKKLTVELFGQEFDESETEMEMQDSLPKSNDKEDKGTSENLKTTSTGKLETKVDMLLHVTEDKGARENLKTTKEKFKQELKKPEISLLGHQSGDLKVEKNKVEKRCLNEKSEAIIVLEIPPKEDENNTRQDNQLRKVEKPTEHNKSLLKTDSSKNHNVKHVEVKQPKRRSSQLSKVENRQENHPFKISCLEKFKNLTKGKKKNVEEIRKSTEKHNKEIMKHEKREDKIMSEKQLKKDDSKSKENTEPLKKAETGCDTDNAKLINNENKAIDLSKKTIIDNIDKGNRHAEEKGEENKSNSKLDQLVGQGTKNDGKEVVEEKKSCQEQKKINVESKLAHNEDNIKKNPAAVSNEKVKRKSGNLKVKLKNQHKSSKAQKENLEEVTYKLHLRLQETQLVQSTLTTDSNTVQCIDTLNTLSNNEEVSIHDLENSKSEVADSKDISIVDEEIKVERKTDEKVSPKRNRKLSEKLVDVEIQPQSKETPVSDPKIFNSDKEHEKNVKQESNTDSLKIRETVKGDSLKQDNKSQENEKGTNRRRSMGTVSKRVLRSASKRNSLSENTVKQDNNNTLLESQRINLVHSFHSEDIPVLHIGEMESLDCVTVEMLRQDLNLSSSGTENASFSVPENDKSLIIKTNNVSALNDSIICTPPRRKRRRVIFTIDD